MNGSKERISVKFIMGHKQINADGTITENGSLSLFISSVTLINLSYQLSGTADDMKSETSPELNGSAKKNELQAAVEEAEANIGEDNGEEHTHICCRWGPEWLKGAARPHTVIG